ncbi:MAG: two-component system response regulator [Nitrospinaceae bacterium]|nr:MAG: two-component system response regulator [Nitrospinaceae bacterium]
MDANQKNILLIDGNKKERLPIAVMLTRFGYKVRMVTYGKEAWDCLQSEVFDLTIVNHVLGDMSGMKFLGQSKKDNNAKVIYLSDKGSIEEFIQVVNLGAFEYVRKPISPVQFAVIVCDFFIENLAEYQINSSACS